MDEIAKKYFHDPEHYKGAMRLLAEHEVSEQQYQNWHDYETHFLANLDEDEDYLLEKAIAYKRELTASSPLQDEYQTS